MSLRTVAASEEARDVADKIVDSRNSSEEAEVCRLQPEFCQKLLTAAETWVRYRYGTSVVGVQEPETQS